MYINIKSAVAVSLQELKDYRTPPKGEYYSYRFKKNNTIRERKPSQCSEENISLALQAGWELTLFSIGANMMTEQIQATGLIAVFLTQEESGTANAVLKEVTYKELGSWASEWLTEVC